MRYSSNIMLRDIRFSCIFLWTKKKLPSFTIQKPKECKRNLIINEHLKNQRMRCESNSTDIFTHKIQRHTICVIQNLTQTKINIYFSWILINVKLIMDFIKSKKKNKWHMIYKPADDVNECFFFCCGVLNGGKTVYWNQICTKLSQKCLTMHPFYTITR